MSWRWDPVRGFQPFYEAPKDDSGGGGGGGDTPKDDDRDKDLEAIAGLGDPGKAAIKAERDAKATALATATAAQKEATRLQGILDKQEADKLKTAEKEAEEKGQFKELAETRATELATAKATIKTLEDKAKLLEETVAKTVEAEWKGLPKEVQEAYSGADDDALAKMAWLPKGKKLAEAINGKTPREGNPPGPPANGDTGKGAETARNRQSAMLGSAF